MKLVVLIDNDLRDFQHLLVMINSIESLKSQVKCFNSDSEAMAFIRSIRASDGQTPATADLILMSYNLKVSKGLQLLEKILDYHNMQSCIPALQAHVVVCSSFAVKVFKDYVVEKGATGFL